MTAAETAKNGGNGAAQEIPRPDPTRMYGITHDLDGKPIIRNVRSTKVGIGVPSGKDIHVWINDEGKWCIEVGVYASGKRQAPEIHRFDESEVRAKYLELWKKAPDRQFPRKLPYFTFLHSNIDGSFTHDFDTIADHGPMPTEIDVVFMKHNPLDASYQWWTAAELKCEGDGVTARRRLEQANNSPYEQGLVKDAKERGERFFPIIEGCYAMGCMIARGDKPKCKPHGRLSLQLIKSELRLGATCTFDTTGFRSISQLFSSIHTIKEITGRGDVEGAPLAGIPLKMVLRPYKTSHNGQASTQYGVALEFRAGKEAVGLVQNLLASADKWRTAVLLPAGEPQRLLEPGPEWEEEDAETELADARALNSEFYGDFKDEQRSADPPTNPWKVSGRSAAQEEKKAEVVTPPPAQSSSSGIPTPAPNGATAAPAPGPVPVPEPEKTAKRGTTTRKVQEMPASGNFNIAQRFGLLKKEIMALTNGDDSPYRTILRKYKFEKSTHIPTEDKATPIEAEIHKLIADLKAGVSNTFTAAAEQKTETKAETNGAAATVDAEFERQKKSVIEIEERLLASGASRVPGVVSDARRSFMRGYLGVEKLPRGSQPDYDMPFWFLHLLSADANHAKRIMDDGTTFGKQVRAGFDEFGTYLESRTGWPDDVRSTVRTVGLGRYPDTGGIDTVEFLDGIAQVDGDGEAGNTGMDTPTLRTFIAVWAITPNVMPLIEESAKTGTSIPDLVLAWGLDLKTATREQVEAKMSKGIFDE